MPKAPPYTQKTLKLFRDAGYTCAVTEKWNHYVGIRQDLFGFIDIIAFKGRETIGIQSSSAALRSRRREKILSLPQAHGWAEGRAIMLVTWRKKKVGNRLRWVPNIEEVLSRLGCSHPAFQGGSEGSEAPLEGELTEKSRPQPKGTDHQPAPQQGS